MLRLTKGVRSINPKWSEHSMRQLRGPEITVHTDPTGVEKVKTVRMGRAKIRLKMDI
jgi:predicted oxidoreductase